MANPANKAFLGLVTAALIGGAALWEGDARKPYEDIVGVLTVCYGYTGPGIQRNKIYTKAECDALLVKEIASTNKGVLECTNVPITQYENDAYTLFAYNVGVPAYCKSGLLKKLNSGQHYEACDGLLAWSFAGGKYVKGLNNRRAYERQMCLGQLK